MMPKKFSISARAVSQIRLMIANYMQHPGATQVYPTIVWVSGSSKEDFTPHPSVGLSVAAEVPTEEIQWIGDFSFVFGVSATDLDRFEGCIFDYERGQFCLLKAALDE